MLLRSVMVILLFLFVLLESTIISFPLVLVASVIAFVLFPEIKTLVVIFLAAFVLDSVRLHMIGITPLVIFAIIFILNFNREFFDIRDYVYLLAVVILGVIVYSHIMDYGISLMISGMIVGALIIFGSVLLKNKKILL